MTSSSIRPASSPDHGCMTTTVAVNHGRPNPTGTDASGSAGESDDAFDRRHETDPRHPSRVGEQAVGGVARVGPYAFGHERRDAPAHRRCRERSSSPPGPTGEVHLL